MGRQEKEDHQASQPANKDANKTTQKGLPKDANKGALSAMSKQVVAPSKVGGGGGGGKNGKAPPGKTASAGKQAGGR